MLKRLVLLLFIIPLLLGCNSTPVNPSGSQETSSPSPVSPSPTAPATLTPRPTFSQTASPTSFPTRTNTPTYTPSPSDLRSPTPCPTLTLTPTPSDTPDYTATPTYTPSPTNTSTSTPDPAATVTPTPTRTPTITPGPSPTGTITNTPTPSITPTQHPCPSSTPTPTKTPTVTPELPTLADLALTTDDLDRLFPNFWIPEPKSFAGLLVGLNGQCKVECLGLRWTSRDLSTTLSVLIYRTPNFTDAYSLNIATQYYYLQQGYTNQTAPRGYSISGEFWAEGLKNKNYVVGMSQGPAVVSIFWQSERTQPPIDVLGPLSAALDKQVSLLRDNGYLIQFPTQLAPED